jgi:glycosyltransferase involved in cell wall biosynthesis
MAAADLLISASRTEGAPLAIREARALGVPVVSCPAGDLASWARHDGGLWLTRAGGKEGR